MHNEILSHLGLIDRLPLTLVSNQFSTQLPEGIQIQSLAKKTLEQLANDEAILWIDKQLVSQTPDELIRNICKRTNSIPDDLIKKTVFTILVERGANLKDDENPLLIAALYDHADIIPTLAELGANVDTRNDSGETPLWIAAQNGHNDVIYRLAELRASVHTPNDKGVTPAWVASNNGYIDTVNLLSEYGADIYAPNEDGLSPFTQAPMIYSC